MKILVLFSSVLTLAILSCGLWAGDAMLEESSLSLAKIEAGVPTHIEISPSEFALTGSRQRLQLVVSGNYLGDETADLTRAAKFEIGDPSIAIVNLRGQVSPLANGTTQIVARAGEQIAVTEISVAGIEENETVSFRYQTLPIFSRAGCSMGACHGSPHGKGGFRLSLRASDPSLDEFTVAKEDFGRRVNLIEPGQSLLLAKPLTEISHEGGTRLRKSDFEFELLRDWIAGGCEIDREAPECIGITVTPGINTFRRRPHHVQQFRVEAHFSDGTLRDVTHLAAFESSDEKICKVSRHGLAVGLRRGEAAVIVRYLDHIQSTLMSFVEDIPGFEWQAKRPVNFVDTHINQKLQRFQYLPSRQCRDDEFVRRVHLDLTGLLPSPETTVAFIESNNTNKRNELIDRLLDSPAHHAFWAQKWGDLLRLSTKKIGHRGVFKFARWLRQSIERNQPYDKFARDLLLVSGSNLIHPQANYYRSSSDTSDIMESTAQLFMGSRIACAKCHNHPFEPWTQDNYYGLSAFFNRIKNRKTSRPEEHLVWAATEGEVTHPASGERVTPWLPGGGAVGGSDTDTDRRKTFTNWLTAKENPFFARVEVNRIWANLFGSGIVEPSDDFRDSNPPANAPLLDELADYFVNSGFDRRKVLRTILISNTYQTSSLPNEFNRDDMRFFSHYPARRLTAEQLVDGLGEVTGAPEKFKYMPAGTKATQLPAPDLKPHDRGKIGEIEFLKVFGQPERQTVCECERGDDSSLGQALELYNGQLIHRMLTKKDNRIAKALTAGTDEKKLREIITDFYLRALSRYPSEKEMRVGVGYISTAEDAGKLSALQDFVWAIVNKDEFLFQH